MIIPKVNNTIDICIARLFDKYETEAQAEGKQQRQKINKVRKEISFILPTTLKIIKHIIEGAGGFVGGSAFILAFLRDQIIKAAGDVIPLKNIRNTVEIKRALDKRSP